MQKQTTKKSSSVTISFHLLCQYLKVSLFQFSSVQSLDHVWLFATPWTAECEAFLSFTNSCSLLRLMSIKSVTPPNHLILCHSLLLSPSIFPSIRVFSNDSVLRIRWPEYWQWIFMTDFLYDWLVWSPCSPRDSQESSPTPQFKNINSSALSFLYSPTLTSIHDYLKNHSCDYMDLCWPSNISAF